MSDVNGPQRKNRAPASSRAIPSIEQLRQRQGLRALEDRYGRNAIVTALRAEADLLRNRMRGGTGGTDSAGRETSFQPPLPDNVADYLESRAERRLRDLFTGSLRPVVNATGIIVHTNLGRAPLSEHAIDRLMTAARGYSNLEFDLSTGRRGRRDTHAAALLTQLTGAEAAVVVNNNAAATLLILSALASGREVIISRGELVEIGGGFRVPEVMAQSGAMLREVGTTNRTRIGDYEAALGEGTALILRVHRSNFRIEGFTEQPAIADLVALGRRAGVPVVEDLGSGWMDTESVEGDNPGFAFDAALRDEPTVRASIAAGLDLVCFSGDKLLGGPQAGIIIGRAALVDRCRRHPLMRALRVDKLTYAALEGTLLAYLSGKAAETVPVLRMLTESAEGVERRVRRVMEATGPQPRFALDVADGESMVGGGSAPGLPVATRLLVLRPASGCDAAALEAELRGCDPPVIGRVEKDCVLLDLRTVLPAEDDVLVTALRTVGGHPTENGQD